MAGSTPPCLPLSSPRGASSPLARCRARRSPRLSSTSLSSPTPARTWPTSGRASRRRSVATEARLPCRTRSRELWRRSARRLPLLLLLLLLLFPPAAAAAAAAASRAYHHRRRRQPRRSVEGSPSRTSTSPPFKVDRVFDSLSLTIAPGERSLCRRQRLGQEHHLCARAALLRAHRGRVLSTARISLADERSLRRKIAWVQQELPLVRLAAAACAPTLASVRPFCWPFPSRYAIHPERSFSARPVPPGSSPTRPSAKTSCTVCGMCPTRR